jgi:predicted GIY-YIG superfamily endonuclease
MALSEAESPTKAESKGVSSFDQISPSSPQRKGLPPPEEAPFFMPFYTYILELSNHRLYVDKTADISQRLQDHASGKGTQTTRPIGVLGLIFLQEFETMEEAGKREHQLKGWSRAKKLALSKGDLNQLKTLSKRRS